MSTKIGATTMSGIHLTHKIPTALNNILKEEQKSTTQLFNDSLPRLLFSYGQLCSENGVHAEMPIEMKRSRAFWSAMSHHHYRDAQDIAVEYCIFWLGFCPTNKEEKRLVIDEAALLLTRQELENDIERDKWLDQYGSIVFPGYAHYAEVMQMRWLPL